MAIIACMNYFKRIICAHRASASQTQDLHVIYRYSTSTEVLVQRGRREVTAGPKHLAAEASTSGSIQVSMLQLRQDHTLSLCQSVTNTGDPQEVHLLQEVQAETVMASCLGHHTVT